ncbi:MAG: SMC-Scp complex subunit ScpB [Candidatus Carbobacillus altaicus]|uniref:Segregation and condensation protein B n=1 Tax=Candidatus Carbonibacillus altaicus TaxID=2163959 RepID=A0A2R6XZQ3_9BACL|nr:SMC-Scp complex subunit ScpB [Candidatus Carbobacillus altaicus]PTQ55901.1 MAG: Segregation and condensation protein B [Candidatus Carbobacillus altaicus]PTQ55963.1 MAG: Segregation and condensation protein B [Candidatus Carbobacillus altaicus]
MLDPDHDRHLARIEALIFASGDEGIPFSQIAQILHISEEEAKSAVRALKARYDEEKRGMEIVERAGYYMMTTRPDYLPDLLALMQKPRASVLSQAALETLAIIAYRQPITRLEIEEIRGVASERAIGTLLARGLIQEVGRREVVGRPIVFGTTDRFLKVFGLSSLADLPPLPEDKKLTEKPLFE